MRNLVLTAALAAFASPAAGAPAAPATTRAMTCPVGGAKFQFQFQPIASPVVAGERPDGRPVGGIKFPLALPECPDNGLVLYKEYDAGEVAKLEPLIASEAYRALRKDETQYYRAYWLMREMSLPPERYLWALLQASWEAEGRPDLRKRYLEELVEASAKVLQRPGDLSWIGMEGRAINALRELGRFDEALARLDKVPLTGLDAPAPTGAAATPQALAQARSRRGWRSFFTAIRPAIERRDSSIEPLDLLPRSVAAGRCLDEAGKLDETGRAFCAKEAETVAAVKAARDKQAKELEALRRSREASGR
jgi:tetratricopeptide (TPR) repeat protein